MDVRKLETKIINEAISKGNYEITGALKTGELVIAIVGDLEKECLELILNSDKSKEEKLISIQALMGTRGRPAEELLQIYKQKECCNTERYFKGLRPR